MGGLGEDVPVRSDLARGSSLFPMESGSHLALIWPSNLFLLELSTVCVSSSRVCHCLQAAFLPLHQADSSTLLCSLGPGLPSVTHHQVCSLPAFPVCPHRQRWVLSPSRSRPRKSW